MKIRCKNCGAQYFIKDELITEKGIRVKCGKCGYTFVIRKKIKKKEFSEKRIGLEPSFEKRASEISEAYSEESFILEWRGSSFSLRLFLMMLVLIFLAEVGFYLYKFRQVKREEAYFYLLRNLEYGYLKDFLRSAQKVVDNSNDPVFYYLVGEAYYLLQDERCKIYFKKAAYLIKDKAIKGSLLIRAGHVAQGLNLLKEVLVVKEKNTLKIKNDMAVGLLKLGDERGLILLKNLSPKILFTPEFNQSVYFLEEGDLNKAKSFIEHLYGMFPGDPVPMVNLSAISLKRNEPFKAIQILRIAKGEHKYMPLVIHNLRIAYGMLKDERAKAYEEKDLIDKDAPVWVSYQYLLNPVVER